MRSCLVVALIAACHSSAHSPDAAESTGDGRTGDSAGSGSDAVVSSFVFVGCNRIQKADLDPAGDPSSANLAELKQDFADIAALPDRPKYWFFVGDLVTNLVSGSTTMQAQLDAWAQVYAASPVASMLELVPVVGNHEMLYKTTVGNAKVELSNPKADAVWRAWLATNHFAKHGGNGPTNAGSNDDALQDDQSSLTYSFDDGSAHFIVLDTDSWTTTPDPTTGDTQIGWVAQHWLAADLAAAQANPAITGIYVFGHKPLVAPGTSSDGTLNAAQVVAVEQLLDSTPKVKGYFAAHVHEWFSTKLPGARGVYQIVAGNGGSELETAWTEPQPYFGFTLVRIYASGKLGVVSYRRPAPTPYNATTTTPAVADPELVISAQ
ncbi:MAG TPA: hypothetical protein VLT45_10480 [Kofleriaceae bacterium]|nr:hypothetical protein [Kofleriaceae bacterium]